MLPEYLSIGANLISVAIPLIISIFLVYISGVIRYIENDSIGILEKLWSIKGSVEEGLIALDGEAGFQPNVLRGGFHFFCHFNIAYTKHHWLQFHKGKLVMSLPVMVSLLLPLKL